MNTQECHIFLKLHTERDALMRMRINCMFMYYISRCSPLRLLKLDKNLASVLLANEFCSNEQEKMLYFVIIVLYTSFSLFILEAAYSLDWRYAYNGAAL